MVGCGVVFGLVGPANRCCLWVALPPPTLRRSDSYDQAPIEVSCGVFADSADGCHGCQPLRLTPVLPAFSEGDVEVMLVRLSRSSAA